MKMRAAILFIFLITTGYFIHAQDTIFWSGNKKLTWRDFKGMPDSLSGFKAMTMAGIGSGVRYNERSFSYNVDCYFLPKQSWTLTDSVNLLSHEQGHFDISELFARKLRKAFSDYQFNYTTINMDLQRIRGEILRLRDEMNNQYDRETDFSRDKKQQQAWNSRIKAELEKLKDCATN
jgi:hypothetical protein